jgi:uncharacterized protein
VDQVELKTKIQDEMKLAMRGHSKERLSAIRLILSAIKQQEVDKRIQLSNEQITDILVKMIKQRKESIAQFQIANREDLINKENFEITVINEFLPEQLSANDILQLIEQALAVNNASSIKDMAKVMQYLREHLLGKADLEQVGKLVKDRLLKA